jgi:hypothetical protein
VADGLATEEGAGQFAAEISGQDARRGCQRQSAAPLLNCQGFLYWPVWYWPLLGAAGPF